MTNTLPWITDSDLQKAVDQFVERANTAKRQASVRMKKNVVDPFSSLIVALTLNVDSKEALVSTQQNASALGGIYNALGEFHQQVLSSVDGWVNHDASYDLENSGKKMLVEIKNKHNTMNSKNREAVESKLNSALQTKGQGWTAYLVVIIPKKPERYKKQLIMKRPVYEIDGATFYDLATNDPNALYNLFHAAIGILNSNGRDIPSDVLAYCKEVYDRYMPPPKMS